MIAALAAALALTAAGCARPKASTAPHVWVPRSASQGLTIDAQSSRVAEIYAPAEAEERADQGE